MPRNSACREVEAGSARISSRLPTDLPRAPVTRPWKWWTMSGRWADRALAPRCSTKSPQIPHGSRLLFSIWATLSCRPTPAPAVRLKLYSSDGPDPARAPRTGSIQRNFLHRGWHLAADRGRLTGYSSLIGLGKNVPTKRPLCETWERVSHPDPNGSPDRRP